MFNYVLYVMPYFSYFIANLEILILGQEILFDKYSWGRLIKSIKKLFNTLEKLCVTTFR